MKKVLLKENLIWEYFCVYQAVFIIISFMSPIIFKSIQRRLVKVKVTQLCLTLCDLMDYTVHGILQARPEYWSLSLLQGIFPTQGLNPGLPHCGQTLYPLSHHGSPKMLCYVSGTVLNSFYVSLNPLHR